LGEIDDGKFGLSLMTVEFYRKIGESKTRQWLVCWFNKRKTKVLEVGKEEVRVFANPISNLNKTIIAFRKGG
jgi:hypothetical protein